MMLILRGIINTCQVAGDAVMIHTTCTCVYGLGDGLARRIMQARAQGRFLKYIATVIREGKAYVELREVEPSHPTMHLSLRANLIQI